MKALIKKLLKQINSLILLFALCAVQANTMTSNLQALAVSYAQESNVILAQGRWTRIEFSRIYIDPIVVVNNLDNTYVTGVRNVDETGFEVMLKSCIDARRIEENINYFVIEKDNLPENDSIRQMFLWGEC